jgi:hypothetical protein
MHSALCAYQAPVGVVQGQPVSQAASPVMSAQITLLDAQRICGGQTIVTAYDRSIILGIRKNSMLCTVHYALIRPCPGVIQCQPVGRPCHAHAKRTAGCPVHLRRTSVCNGISQIHHLRCEKEQHATHCALNAYQAPFRGGPVPACEPRVRPCRVHTDKTAGCPAHLQGKH